RSLPHSVFPLYHVLADVGEFAGGEVVPSRSSQPLQVDGLVLQKDGRSRLLLANLSAEPQRVMVHGVGRAPRVRMMDQTNVEEAMQSPEVFRAGEGEQVQSVDGKLELNLRPFAMARIDWGDQS